MGSFDIQDYVFFFFRENAVEYINCGKNIYSRVARICKGDMGGKNILAKSWATYLKARLNCSIPGEFPFYFNEIRKIFFFLFLPLNFLLSLSLHSKFLSFLPLSFSLSLSVSFSPFLNFFFLFLPISLSPYFSFSLLSFFLSFSILLEGKERRMEFRSHHLPSPS